VFLSGLSENAIDDLFERGAQAPLINIGYGSDMSISELAGCVAALVGYTGEPVFDASFPDGTPQKLLDSSRIRALGWKPATRFEDGIRLTYADFLARHGNSTGARDG
jgi:GDP-L-fucose synthase